MSEAGAKNQVSRLLALVPYLYSRGDGISLAQASADLNVSADVLISDLKVLFMCGLPGGYPDDLIDVDLDALEDEGVVRVSNADYFARPLRLTATEASALIVALRAQRAGADAATVDVVDRALAKLELAGASEPLPPIDPGEADPIVVAARARLDEAISEGRQVRLRYWVPSRDEESDRLVDPYRIVTAGGFDYLDAWCYEAEAPRLFRLDRIHQADVQDSAAAPRRRRRRTPKASQSSGFFSWDGPDSTLVTLWLGPTAHWVPDYYPVEAVRPLAEGCEVDLYAADPQWLVRLVLRLLPDARVLAPDWLAERVAVERARTLTAYH